MNPPKHWSLWNPSKHSHWRPGDSTFFSRRIYEPARRLYFSFFRLYYYSFRRPQTAVPFFISGRNYEPAKTSELVEPTQPFPLTARRLNFFFPDVIMNPPDDCTFFFSGRNYQSYWGPDDCAYTICNTRKILFLLCLYLKGGNKLNVGIVWFEGKAP